MWTFENLLDGEQPLESTEGVLAAASAWVKATPRWSLTSLVSASASSFIIREAKVINICLPHLILAAILKWNCCIYYFLFFPYSFCYILQFYHLSISSLIISKYRYTFDILADWVPDNLNKVSISVKLVIQITCFPSTYKLYLYYIVVYEVYNNIVSKINVHALIRKYFMLKLLTIIGAFRES